MTVSMKKRERLAAAITGQEVDRVPTALWRHFPVDDVNAEELARSAAAFQQQFDWDFIKLTPSSHYSVADWGTEIEYRGHAHGTSEYISYPVKSVEDWERLQPLDARDGALGQQLVCLKRLRELVGDEVPIIETIFSPMDQARHLIGIGTEIVHLRLYPEKIRAALEVITETTIAFVKAAIEAGADGIFYATQYARASHLSMDEYKAMCRPYDLKILEAANSGTFNMLHLHGQNTYFDLFTDYPVHAINWHDRETAPSIGEGKKRFPRLVFGGVSQQEIVESTPRFVRNIAKQSIAETGGQRMGLSTGCVIPTVTPWGNIRALREAVT